MLKKNLLMVAALAWGAALSAQYVSEKNIRKTVYYLASDKLEGRGTGSKGEDKAAKYIAKSYKKAGLQPKGDNQTWYHHFTFTPSANPHSTAPAVGKTIKSRNVVGYLDNGAPYTVVIGAHYDHLGMGHDHNSLEANSAGKIHNGADDNASGVAGVLELARYFSRNKVKEQYNYLFICFSGEELGLVGSKRFAEFPTIDLKTVHFMVNMDMIGRLNPEGKLMVGGVGTAPDFVPLLERLQTDLVLAKDSSGVGPSDHTSFYLKNIPVLFFFTGQHTDYHKPSDDAHLVNYPGATKVVNLIAEVIQNLDKKPKLTFQETKNKTADTPAFKVTLGIMPDYVWEKEGVHVDGVTTGRPADKAGVQRGDVILGMGDMPVNTMEDYMQCLSKFQKGQSTTLKIKRGSEMMMLPLTF
jgi:hypothetical protein